MEENPNISFSHYMIRRFLDAISKDASIALRIWEFLTPSERRVAADLLSYAIANGEDDQNDGNILFPPSE